MRTRTSSPPMLERTTSRRVWLLKCAVPAGSGLMWPTAQEATNDESSSCAKALLPMIAATNAKQTSAARCAVKRIDAMVVPPLGSKVLAPFPLGKAWATAHLEVGFDFRIGNRIRARHGSSAARE